MCNASGRLQGNERTWNPYNYVLSKRVPGTSLGNWGAFLSVGAYQLDVAESEVDIYREDVLTYRIIIPQKGTFDSVDRIEFILSFISLLQNDTDLTAITEAVAPYGSEVTAVAPLSEQQGDAVGGEGQQPGDQSVVDDAEGGVVP